MKPEDFVAPPRNPSTPFAAQELANQFNLEIMGHEDREILRPERPQDISDTGSITWLRNWDSPQLDILLDKPGGTVVAPELMLAQDEIALKRLCEVHVVLISRNPRMTFAILLGHCFPHLEMSTYIRFPDATAADLQAIQGRPRPRIDTSARIDPTAVVHPGVEICAGVYIGPGVHVGRNSWIQPNAVIHEGTIIGHRCIVGSNTVIGGRGFGFVRDDAGELVHMPHVGAVMIGNDVEVGSNTSIDRAVMEYTRIGDGSKIDNLVHIAHGAKIGRHCVIVACAELGAGVVVEDYAWVGPNACSLENVRIGQRAVVGAGAVVTRSVGDEETVAGSPAERTDILRLRREVVKRLIEEL